MASLIKLLSALSVFIMLIMSLAGCSSLSTDRLNVDPDRFNVNEDSLDVADPDRFNFDEDSANIDPDKFNVNDD